jgi:hypothetical protein
MNCLKVVYFAETCPSNVATIYLHVVDIVHGWFNERIQRKLVVKYLVRRITRKQDKNMKYN